MTDGALRGMGVLVTGGGTGIGRACAEALAADGAVVTICGRTEDRLVDAVDQIRTGHGGSVHHVVADVTSEEAVQGMIDAAVDAFGRLDILINNVGPGTSSPITELTYAEWRRIMASKLDSAFLCSKAAIPHLGVHGQGVIINIGASSAHVGNANRSVDGAAKMGLAGLTGSLAIELAPQNITVNCVAPGRIQRPGATSPHFAARPIPAGREGTPEEFAETVRFLCGPHSRFTTGQTLHVNGGWYVSIN